MNINILKKIGFGVLTIFAIIGFGFISVFFAIKWGWTNSKGIIDNQQEEFVNQEDNLNNDVATTTDFVWEKTEEWDVIKKAVLKDRGDLERASIIAGVKPRIILANLAVEQLRMFYSDRESYKKFFSPLKILGSQTKFSWGVMGMKEDTAIQVENNLKDKNSPYYLGPEYENLLNFHTEDISKERFIRMTDQYDHFGSYLYAGLYMRQIVHQWQVAGFPIANKIDILSTLYNVGFKNSKPNSDPKSGGAQIEIEGIKYSFGKLAKEVYDSNELIDEFPR